jgi:hypothetical protein
VIAASNVVNQFQKAVSKAADRAAKEVNCPKDITRVIGRHLSTLTQMSEPEFIDLAQLDTGSISLPLTRLEDHRAQHARHSARRADDEMHSKAMLEEMVNPKDEHDPTPSENTAELDGETICVEGSLVTSTLTRSGQRITSQLHSTIRASWEKQHR